MSWLYSYNKKENNMTEKSDWISRSTHILPLDTMQMQNLLQYPEDAKQNSKNNEKSPCQAASWDLEMLSSWPIDEICGKQLIYPPHWICERVTKESSSVPKKYNQNFMIMLIKQS